MIAASINNFPTQYSLQNLGFDVAIKTGTPQVDGRVQDSFFIGYAPAENPEIAFAGVIEGGEYSKYMIRSIIQAYQQCVKGENVTIDNFVTTTATTTAASSASTTTVTTASQHS